MVQLINNLGVITEVLLYINFAVLMGGLLLSLVPEANRPPVFISKVILLTSVTLIPILSFTPLLEVVLLLSTNIGFTATLNNILSSFEIGKAWLFTAFVAIALFALLSIINIKKNKAGITNALLLTVLMTFSAGYASHASSIGGLVGFMSHSFHFLAVIIWTGVVLFVGWFSDKPKNWQLFLKWFSPLAITCVLVLLITGFMTMKIDINSYEKLDATMLQEYKDSLVITYGQSLLIKHLFIIPLLLFAFFNAVLIRKKLQSNSRYNPIKWVKAESIFMIFVLIATAFMGQDYPPHQVTQLVNTSGFSSLFEFVNNKVLDLPIHVVFNYSWTSYVLFFLAILSTGLMILFASRSKGPAWSFVFGIVFVICSYTGIVLGINS